MVSVGQHPKIKLLTYSEVEGVTGYVGNFQVKVRQKARYVDPSLCTGCGLCETKCPVRRIPNEFDLGLGQRHAIYRPFAQAVPSTPTLDAENCIYFQRGKCRACEKLCPRHAIDFAQKDTSLELQVGTIILATGFDPSDAARVAESGHGMDNVLTGLEFERLINASGPTAGKVLMKDGKAPQTIAILHCIGSRDEKYNAYCSRVCCMYSLKLAHLVRDTTGAQVCEVYRDMRSFGKGYEEFFTRVENEGVVFVRRNQDVQVTGQDGHLLVKAQDVYTGQDVALMVDMVVLGTGMAPRKDAGAVARTFGIGRSRDGFFSEKHPKLAPVETASGGVFIAGTCQGPKDIPDTVAQAGAAAAAALDMMDLGIVALDPSVAHVKTERCAGCGECAIACPYGAIQVVDGVAQVSEYLCKGCGTCASACSPKAIWLDHFTDEQLVAEIQGLLSLEVA
jgi:heterodisulfide reductase subunit A